jgi:hypothetical protein
MKLVYSFYLLLILYCSLPSGPATNSRSVHNMTSRQKYAEPVFFCPFTDSGCHRVLRNKSGQSQHKGMCKFNPVNIIHHPTPPLPTSPPHSPEQYTLPRTPTGPRTPRLGGSGTPHRRPPTPYRNSPQRQPPPDIISVEHHPHLNGECKI